MSYLMPTYHAPDFSENRFIHAPDAKTAICDIDGVAPDNYHSTSIYPEYFKIRGAWLLAEESRMDCAVVIRENGVLDVIEMRNLRIGDEVILGRRENCEDGIFLHADGFIGEEGSKDQFAFRQGRSRETAFSWDYDNLYNLLLNERQYGTVVWVLGPAFAFDFASRRAMKILL